MGKSAGRSGLHLIHGRGGVLALEDFENLGALACIDHEVHF